MSSLLRKWLFGTALLVAIAITGWKLAIAPPTRPLPPLPPGEIIPPGIVVTETSTVAPPPPPSTGSAPGDRALVDYASSGLTPQNDLQLLSNTLTNFLTLSKQANAHPLSANEEWSAALRGKRPGSEVWISEQHRIVDSQKRLIDRWGTPLHFHALGGQQWEIRSAGPDRKWWTGDDLMEPLPRSSGTR
jgi:hypothetical protein